MKADLKIKYSAKGSAIPGTDYVALKGTAIIKAGETSRIIKIKPLGDLEGASQKVVRIKLEPSSDYTPATTSFVDVKIIAGP